MIEITTKDQFIKFKSEFSGKITKVEEFDDGFEIEIDSLNWVFLPLNCKAWIDETLAQIPDPYANDLIFGKDKTKNVVSCEVSNDLVYIYTEDQSGVKLETRPFKRWIMSNDRPNGIYSQMAGNLHYKYLKEFNTEKDYKAALAKLWKTGADKYTCYDQSEAYMVRSGLTYFKGMKVDDISLLSFDIETNSVLSPELPHAKILIIANTYRKNGIITQKSFNLDEFKNELEMIESWCEWVRMVDPSVMIGQNIFMFDLPFIHKRYLITQETQVGKFPIEKGLALGRDGSIMSISAKSSKKRIPGADKLEYNKVRIFGRELVDNWFLSMDYDVAKNFISYGLKQVVSQLGFEKENRTFWNFDEENANEIWEKRDQPEFAPKWAAYKQYCMDDTEDPIKLFDLMIPAKFYSTVTKPITFQGMCESAPGKQINSFMIREYLRHGHSIPKPSKKAEFEGAISYGKPGIYHNVYKLDVASLYPSIMMQWDIYNHQKDPLRIFPQMLEYFTNERLNNKAIANTTGSKYHRDLEQSEKIDINSAYGFYGTEGLHFNSPEHASEVTRRGRQILTDAVIWASGYEFEKVCKNPGKKTPEYHWVLDKKVSEGQGMIIPNTDTDSFSFAYPDGRKLSKEDFTKISQQVNDLFPEKIIWEDDGHFDDFVVVAAKNYIMRYIDPKKNESVVKIKGSGLKDSKKELILKTMMQEVAVELLSDNIDGVLAIYKKYCKMAVAPIIDIKKWVSKKTISDKVMACANDPYARSQELKVWNAIQGKNLTQGDKVWVYVYYDGLKQSSKKGELQTYADGRPKMEPNYILKCVEDYNNDHCPEKLLARCYDTICIFDSVLDVKQFIDYSKPSGAKALEKLKLDSAQ